MMMAMAQTMKGQVVINEFMQSNIDCIMDDLNEFPDSWVELYNDGNSYVNLGIYSIGTADDAAKAWHLPSRNLAPHQYVIIYCDKEATGLHTDFRLDSGKGGAIYLFSGGAVADKVTGIKKQPAPNIAYGRKTDASDEWGYMLQPTPGAANAGGTSSNILSEPVFSVKGRVFTSTQNIALALSLPEGAPDGTEIRYTTDGSEPTASSKRYTAPINIRSTTIVRAKLFCSGYLSPRSTVQSYIYHGRTQTLPIVSITTDKNYLYDSKIGIYTEGTGQKKNYEYDWRRPINIEMYDTDGTTCVLNQLCETRIQGGATRAMNPLKSLAIYANKRFGEKRLAYEFFPDQRPGQTNFKSIILRNAGNDFDYLYMRDAIIHRTMFFNCDIDCQAWRPAIVYINGVYKGIENIRERSNEDNIFTNYDELEDIDMIENWVDLKTGTWDNYNDMIAFVNENHTMEEYAQHMDIEEFINLMAAAMYYCNTDFPGNNIVMWRPRAEGGRWRWLMKDMDFGLGLFGAPADYNYIKWLYDNNYDKNNTWGNVPHATLLFRRLMETAGFNREFIDHMAVYMGDFMNERGTREQWDPMYEMIRTEYPIHRRLYNPWWPNYDTELNNARTWLRNRAANMYKHLADFYKLGSPIVLKVNADISSDELADVNIFVNGIRLTKGNLDGRFFVGRQLKLSSTSDTGRQVTGWQLRYNGNTITINEPEYTFNMPNTPVNVSAIIETVTTGIKDVNASQQAKKPSKVLRNGRICIQHDGAVYDIMGRPASVL